MSESVQLNIGALRSQMTLQIHTRHAARLWYGRKPTEGRQGILGLNGFLAISNRINIGSRQDDPYCDWWMLRIEEKIDQVNEQLQQLKQEVDGVFASVPSTFKLTDNVNIQPANLPVFAGSQLGYLAIFALAQYDDIVRKAMLAFHIGLIMRVELEEHWLERGDHYLRSLFALVQRFRYSGTTRKDFREGNAVAKIAIEKFGEVPADIFDGTKRSRFSPPVRTGPDEIIADLEDEPEASPALTLIVPDETEVGEEED